MIKRLILLEIILLLVCGWCFGQQPSAYQVQLITYPSTPFGICEIYQVAQNVSTGIYYACNTTTNPHVWQVMGSITNVTVAPTGACSAGSNPQQVISTGILYTCQSGTWGQVSGTGISLKTNNTPNGSQSTLNLAQGSGITVVDNGSGTDTITNTGGTTTGTVGQVQATDGSGGHKTTSITDNGTNVSVTEPFSYLKNSGNYTGRGPNPTVDITAAPFYGRVINPNSIPSGTVTCTSSSTSIGVVSGLSSMQNNDGIAIPGCGPTQTMSTPLAPVSVVPSVPKSLTGTGFDTAGGAGSTTDCYELMGLDFAGGFTAVGPATCTTTGNSSLGNASTSITGGTISSNTKTYTVGSTSDLAAGEVIRIGGTGDDGEWGGVVQIASIVDGTHFTVTTGISSNYYMSSTTISAGTVYKWYNNTVTLPAPSDGQTVFYGIFRSLNGGAYSLAHITYPINLSGIADSTYLVWEDYGATIQPNLANPLWWIPTTPPASAQNDMLVTTISSGAGTSTLTVANAASNNNPGASVTARFDDAPALIAMWTAANSFVAGVGGGTPYLPPPLEDSNSDYCYLTSSFVDLASIHTGDLTYAGQICLGATLKFNGAIHGIIKDSIRQTAPAFPVGSYPQIQVREAHPGIWFIGSIRMDHMTVATSGNDYLGVFESASGTGSGSIGPDFVDHVNFSSNQSAGDYMGVLEYKFGNPNSQGFVGHYQDTSWNTGPNGNDASVLTPAFIAKSAGGDVFDCFLGSRRGFFAYGGNFSVSVYMNGCSTFQGPVTPILTATGSSSGNITLTHIVPDTAGDPLFTEFVNGYGFGGSLYINGGGQNSAGPLISAHNAQLLHLANWQSAWTILGQNYNFTTSDANPTNFPAVQGFPGYFFDLAYTVGTLPSCNAKYRDTVYVVSDANNPVYNTALTGGGSIRLEAYCNGTNWVPVGGNSSASPGGSPLSVQYNNSGNLGGSSVPVAPNNVVQTLGSTPVGGVGTVATFNLPGVAPRKTACPSNVDTILATDRAGKVFWNDSSACAVTLPQAGSGGGTNNDFTTNFVFTGCNIGAGTVTITPTTSTIDYTNGGAYQSPTTNLPLPTGQCVTITSDNANYFGQVATGGGVTSVSNSDGTLAISPTTAAVVASLALGHANTWSATQIFPNNSITNAELANQSTTVNGQTCTLGSTCTITGSTVSVANAGTTGTTTSTLTKLTGAPSTAVIAATTDTNGVVGITTAGAGTSSNATIQLNGLVNCVFDGATIAGDYVQISSTTAGNCHDTSASTYPAPNTGQVIGRVLSTNGAGGTYQIYLFGPEANTLSSVVTLTGTQTLTNKTLTSPTLTTPAIGAATGTSLQLSGLTASLPICTDGSKNLSSTCTGLITGSMMANNTVTATQLAAQYSKGSCTEVWGGTGTSNALQSGDDAISNNTCYNDSGVTRTITAVKCRSDNGSNTTTVNPTFGSAGTGTTILSGALTCGNSYAYSSSGTVSNASWTTGSGIDPAMGGTLTGTSIAMIVEYTY